MRGKGSCAAKAWLSCAREARNGLTVSTCTCAKQVINHGQACTEVFPGSDSTRGQGFGHATKAAAFQLQECAVVILVVTSEVWPSESP